MNFKKVRDFMYRQICTEIGHRHVFFMDDGSVLDYDVAHDIHYKPCHQFIFGFVSIQHTALCVCSQKKLNENQLTESASYW